MARRVGLRGLRHLAQRRAAARKVDRVHRRYRGGAIACFCLYGTPEPVHASAHPMPVGGGRLGGRSGGVVVSEVGHRAFGTAGFGLLLTAIRIIKTKRKALVSYADLRAYLILRSTLSWRAYKVKRLFMRRS